MSAATLASPEERLTAMLGTDAYCVVCGRWIAPDGTWTVIVGADTLHYVHSSEGFGCLDRDTSGWVFQMPADARVPLPALCKSMK